QTGIGVVARDEENIGAIGAETGQLSREVAVTLRVLGLLDDAPSLFFEALPEGLREPDAVVAAGIDENRRCLRMEVPPGVERLRLSLARIDEADSKDVVHLLRRLDVGRSRRDHWHLIALCDRRGRQAARGRLLSDESHDVVARDQFRDGRGRLRRLVAVVLDEQLDPLAEHATGAIDLVEGHFHAVAPRGREGRLGTRQGAEETDLDSLSLRWLLPSAAHLEKSSRRDQRREERPSHRAAILRSARSPLLVPFRLPSPVSRLPSPVYLLPITSGTIRRFGGQAMSRIS